MNRNEAKAYALNELGLDREHVRQFGNLSRTQTWLDAIAAQASGGIAAQASGGIAAHDAAIASHDEMIVEMPSAIAIASSEVIVEDAIAAQAPGGIAPCKTMIVEETPGIAIPAPAAQDPSFETFWDSAPALLQPQPLLNISVLDGDWDEPEPAASQASEVIVYPLVIGLLMLWAMVQFLLLGGKALCGLLTGLAERLDLLAQERLQRRRESALQPAPALVLALSRLVQGELRQGWTVHLRRHHPQNKTTAQALGGYLAQRGQPSE